MKDDREVTVCADYESLKSLTSLDETILRQTAGILREHVLKTYYLASFACENQVGDQKMWDEYAGGDGFCLLYDRRNIQIALRRSMTSHPSFFHLFEAVDYGNNPTDITPFIAKFFSLIGSDVQNEEKYQLATERIVGSLLPEERNRLMRSFFHKIPGGYPETYEERIVTLRPRNEKKWLEDLLGVPVWPSRVICSSLMKQETIEKIRRFANRRRIDFFLFDDGEVKTPS